MQRTAAAGSAATAAGLGQRIGGASMVFYQKGAVRIYFEEAGSGFPLLVIPGGGLNATIGYLTNGAPFDPMAQFNDEHRCIAADLRNANGGKSSGPLEIDR